MVYTLLTNKAMDIAYHAHQGQLDYNGIPYIFHPIHLAEQMEDEISCCVALLHDVVEDTAVTLADLELGLEDRLSTKVGLLSGGQRQAVTLLMATLQRPKLLLLDEHTAALDPKTAAKVLELTDRIVSEHHLTTLMITHNMRDAITHGNRLIMLDEGHVAVDISGEDKKKLTVEDLLSLFAKASGTEFTDDRTILS